MTRTSYLLGNQEHVRYYDVTPAQYRELKTLFRRELRTQRAYYWRNSRLFMVFPKGKEERREVSLR
jgi:hypothetical protein